MVVLPALLRGPPRLAHCIRGELRGGVHDLRVVRKQRPSHEPTTTQRACPAFPSALRNQVPLLLFGRLGNQVSAGGGPDFRMAPEHQLRTSHLGSSNKRSSDYRRRSTHHRLDAGSLRLGSLLHEAWEAIPEANSRYTANHRHTLRDGRYCDLLRLWCSRWR